MKRIPLLFTFSLLSSYALASEYPFPVHNPPDSTPADHAEKLVPEIYPQVKSLLDHFKEPKDSSFITGSAGKETLKWRLARATILSPELVSLEFTEGHIQVFGIYLRSNKEKRWDLHSEIYGKFRDRSVPDIMEEPSRKDAK
jgi:hypothetical protein